MLYLLEHRQQIFGISLILAYADDIDVVGDSFDTVRGIFLQFQQEAKKMGLNINEDKTKYRPPLSLFVGEITN